MVLLACGAHVSVHLLADGQEVRCPGLWVGTVKKEMDSEEEEDYYMDSEEDGQKKMDSEEEEDDSALPWALKCGGVMVL